MKRSRPSSGGERCAKVADSRPHLAAVVALDLREESRPPVDRAPGRPIPCGPGEGPIFLARASPPAVRRYPSVPLVAQVHLRRPEGLSNAVSREVAVIGRRGCGLMAGGGPRSATPSIPAGARALVLRASDPRPARHHQHDAGARRIRAHSRPRADVRRQGRGGLDTSGRHPALDAGKHQPVKAMEIVRHKPLPADITVPRDAPPGRPPHRLNWLRPQVDQRDIRRRPPNCNGRGRPWASEIGADVATFLSTPTLTLDSEPGCSASLAFTEISGAADRLTHRDRHVCRPPYRECLHFLRATVSPASEDLRRRFLRIFGCRSRSSRTEFAENRELRKRVRLLEEGNKVLRRAAAYPSQADLPRNGSTGSWVSSPPREPPDGDCRVLNLARQSYCRSLVDPVTDSEVTEAHRANVLFDAHRDNPEYFGCGSRP